MAVKLVLFERLFFVCRTELFPLLVCAKEPVPPDKRAGVVPVEVVVVEIMETST